MKRLLPTSKKIIAILVALFLGLGTAFAYDFASKCSTGQWLYYNITDATNHYVELTYPSPDSAFPYAGNPYILPSGDITIPESVTYNGVNYTVTAIGARALYGCDGLIGSLIIPNSVTSIGERAFYDCDGFTGQLTIPNSVTSIGEAAFYNCFGFTGQLTIPNSVTSIGEGAFYNCFGFTGQLTIPNSVTTIGDDAFGYCNGLTGSLTIPNSVTSIGEGAFYNCTGFTGSLTISNSVTTISKYAFNNCSGLTGSLTIPNSVTSIGEGAFYNCFGFTGSLTIPNSVTTIGMRAFYKCSGFTGSLTIGNSVTSIGAAAFYLCSKLTSMTMLPVTPPTFGSSVFEGVPATMPVYVPCGSVSSYLTVLWGLFTNIQSIPFMITVQAWPPEGGAVTGGGSFDCEGGDICTLTATPNEGYQFLCWNSNGTVLSCNSTYSFTVTEDTDITAVFMDEHKGVGNVIGGGETANAYLPSNSYYNHTLSEQIYTVEEIGGSCPIYSISFFNAGIAMTRDYDIYMGHTDKTGFTSNTDWVGVSASDKVFSGSVTMPQGQWTTITLDTPFAYNGNDNLLLVVDDNTGSWIEGMSCRVFETEGYQSLHVFSDEIDYDPTGPMDYDGTRLTWKNQIVLNGDDDLCGLRFELRDSFGDGWNGNYLVVDLGNGLTFQLTVPDGNSEATYTLPVYDGSHVVLSWIEGNWPDECAFVMSSMSGGVPIYAANNLDESYTYEFDLTVCGEGMAWLYLGDDAEETTSHLLPSPSYYSYSLSEQIYTVDEIGSAGVINGIAFFNFGEEKTRTYDIYLKHTDKTSFDSTTDWVNVTADDKVFSGSVTFYPNRFTNIVFDVPFDYNGSSNLLLVVDDNTGDWSNGSMSCLVYETEGNQAIQTNDDDTNYDPSSYAGYGSLSSIKNQVMLGITRTSATQHVSLVAGTNWFSANVDITLDDLKAALVEALPNTVITIKASGSSTSYKPNMHRWIGQLGTGQNVFTLSQLYMITVTADAEFTLEGMPIDAAGLPITIKKGANWISYPLKGSMTLECQTYGSPLVGTAQDP